MYLIIFLPNCTNLQTSTELWKDKQMHWMCFFTGWKDVKNKTNALPIQLFFFLNCNATPILKKKKKKKKIHHLACLYIHPFKEYTF